MEATDEPLDHNPDHPQALKTRGYQNVFGTVESKKGGSYVGKMESDKRVKSPERDLNTRPVDGYFNNYSPSLCQLSYPEVVEIQAWFIAHVSSATGLEHWA